MIFLTKNCLSVNIGLRNLSDGDFMLKTHKFWFFLFAAILVICVGALFLFYRKSGETVLIYHKDELVYKMNLERDETKEFSFDEGVNVVEVKNHEVYVKSADCKNQICVNSKPISAVGSVIVCAPHSLTIKVSGESEEDAYV